jgi:hypothetical protein
VTADEARALALALPEAVEADHHGRASFRVGGAIFATLWSDRELNVMLDEDGIRTACTAEPQTCTEVWWGRRLSAVRVALDGAEPDLVRDLLTDAWERRAPARLRSRR